MENVVLRLASSGRATSCTHEMWCILYFAVVSAVNRTQEDLPMEKTSFKIKEFKIGSLGQSIERTFKITVSLGNSMRGKPYVPIVADL
jgi:hypothetical protein